MICAHQRLLSHVLSDHLQLMIPRMSYLAAAVEDSVNYFREYTAIIDKRSTDGVWFEHNSVPLKRFEIVAPVVMLCLMYLSL